LSVGSGQSIGRLTKTTGNWIASTPIPDQTFESREVRLEGLDKDLLAAFARKVIRWLPEERMSAAELLEEGDGFLTQWIGPELDEDDD
jgi:phosphoserine phosphatase